MKILGWVGMVLAVCGAVMLVAPTPARFILRYIVGVRSTRHSASRVAAWGVLVLGLAVMFLSRLV